MPEPMRGACSKTIVKAHTVPRSGSLKQIARDGHVYSFVPSVQNLIKGEGKLLPQLVGINSASTFTGFCSVHDNVVFSKIEDQPFVASQEQCFLLGYRALAREMYTKKALMLSSDLRRRTDRGKSLDQQVDIQQMNRYLDIGASAGLRDFEAHKTAYDKVLPSGEFDAVRAYVVELDIPPPIMGSGGIFPEQDFDGNQLQDLGNLDVTAHLLTFTSYYGGDGGVVVFTWLSECDPTCRPFIDSLRALPRDRTTDGLLRFFFETCENLHIRPDWWENLEGKKRDALIDRADPSLARDPQCIADDGIRFDDWPIASLRTVGF